MRPRSIKKHPSSNHIGSVTQMVESCAEETQIRKAWIQSLPVLRQIQLVIAKGNMGNLIALFQLPLPLQ